MGLGKLLEIAGFGANTKTLKNTCRRKPILVKLTSSISIWSKDLLSHNWCTKQDHVVTTEYVLPFGCLRRLLSWFSTASSTREYVLLRWSMMRFQVENLASRLVISLQRSLFKFLGGSFVLFQATLKKIPYPPSWTPQFGLHKNNISWCQHPSIRKVHQGLLSKLDPAKAIHLQDGQIWRVPQL